MRNVIHYLCWLGFIICAVFIIIFIVNRLSIRIKIDNNTGKDLSGAIVRIYDNDNEIEESIISLKENKSIHFRLFKNEVYVEVDSSQTDELKPLTTDLWIATRGEVIRIIFNKQGEIEMSYDYE